MKSEVGSLSHRCELVVPTDATILAMVDKLQQTNSHLKVYKVYWYFPFRWKVRWTSEIKNVKLLDSLAQHSTFIHSWDISRTSDPKNAWSSESEEHGPAAGGEEDRERGQAEKLQVCYHKFQSI